VISFLCVALPSAHTVQNFENLAKDKLALETMLANEKRSLESNNQDLEERLKLCVKQLQDTQALLEKEQKLNEDIERSRSEAESSKVGLQKTLSDKEEENAQLRATILNLQAMHEKEKGLSEQLQGQLADTQKSVETLQDQLQQAEEARAGSEHEREELLSQIAILTEERDGARAQEEELFEKLAERTNDLDRLRESYVEITDRWNDTQDENMDLRDKVESLQSAIEARAYLATSAPAYHQPAFFSAPAPAPVAATATSAATPVIAAPKVLQSDQASPRGAAAKGTKAVPPSGEGRTAKASPRGTPGHQFVAPDQSHSMLAADGKNGNALPLSGASPPMKPSTTSSSGAGAALSGSSPRKPPPAGDYADEYFDDYEDEFEAED
jgi:uncharacterized protein YoxC